MDTTMDYRSFLATKQYESTQAGFDPTYMPDFLFDFQESLVNWSVKMGRSALFEDCGLGKTAQQLVWAENVVRHTNKPVLVLTPLAVAAQTVREAEKFGIDASQSRDGKPGKNITVTNYEKLHHFDWSDYGGIVCDESSAIKNFDGKRKEIVTDFARRLPYRLLCTATAAPNDFHELGTSSEALGFLGYRDMITRFFIQDTEKDFLGWGRTKYRLRGHAEHPFWRWVCSWARAIRKPSDVGGDDARFILPELIEKEILVTDATPRDGFLFSVPARSMQEQRDERRATIRERCEMVAQSVPDRPTVIWCHFNEEADLLEQLIDGSRQVSGGMKDGQKEEYLQAFTDGTLKTLITKPKIGCWGLNWQHCSDVFAFPSHSFEQYYQAVRRCWRFGQKNPVTVTIVTTEGEVSVMANLRNKASQADIMFSRLVECMNDELSLITEDGHIQPTEVPAWL